MQKERNETKKEKHADNTATLRFATEAKAKSVLLIKQI